MAPQPANVPFSPVPKQSMYGIFTYIWLIFYGFHVGKYAIHGWYRVEFSKNGSTFSKKGLHTDGELPCFTIHMVFLIVTQMIPIILPPTLTQK